METLLYLGPEGDNLDQKFNLFTYLYLCEKPHVWMYTRFLGSSRLGITPRLQSSLRMPENKDRIKMIL